MRSTEAFWLVLTIASCAAGQTPPPAAAAPAPAESPFAGSEACGACHEDIYKAFAKTPHHGLDVVTKSAAATTAATKTPAAKSNTKHQWEGRACEACHGPGQKHAESADAANIRNPSKLTAAATDEICLTCHLNQPTHMGRLQSSHAKNQVACTTCHKVHADEGHSLVVRKPVAVNQQCAACHVNVWAQFQQPAHHKLPEGAMSCVDCHNPHGSIRPAMTQSFAANEPGCLRCHGDKRGPFTFEHGPVRFEGCATCHEPHGSANPRMLARQEVRMVCLECHANLPTSNKSGTIGVVPPAFHDLRSPRYQNCTVCHQKIHGSYVDRNLLR